MFGERIRRSFWLGSREAGQNGRRPRRASLECPRMSEPDVPTQRFIYKKGYPYEEIEIAGARFPEIDIVDTGFSLVTTQLILNIRLWTLLQSGAERPWAVWFFG